MENKPDSFISQENSIPGTSENWDNRVLGASEQHVAVSKLDPAEVDTALGLVTIKLRVNKADADKLEALAKQQGLILQAYIKSVLAKELTKA